VADTLLAAVFSGLVTGFRKAAFPPYAFGAVAMLVGMASSSRANQPCANDTQVIISLPVGAQTLCPVDPVGGLICAGVGVCSGTIGIAPTEEFYGPALASRLTGIPTTHRLSITCRRECRS